MSSKSKYSLAVVFFLEITVQIDIECSKAISRVIQPLEIATVAAKTTAPVPPSSPRRLHLKAVHMTLL
jgi:hypothetical protein